MSETSSSKAIAEAPERARLAYHHPMVRMRARAHHGLKAFDPIKLVVLGYLAYMMAGWGLLSLPVSQPAGVEVGALDNLFIAASAVSTTGLVTVDPGTSYSAFGQAVILILIQAGGLGYMTFSSFVAISLSTRMSRFRHQVTSTAFALPTGFEPRRFIRRVVVFSLVAESLGALALWAAFVEAGVDDPVWSAVFHSVSAFCTAGFSLYATSFEGFASNVWVLVILSVLSLLGAIGFIVLSEW